MPSPARELAVGRQAGQAGAGKAGDKCWEKANVKVLARFFIWCGLWLCEKEPHPCCSAGGCAPGVPALGAGQAALPLAEQPFHTLGEDVFKKALLLSTVGNELVGPAGAAGSSKARSPASFDGGPGADAGSAETRGSLNGEI